MLNKKNNPVPRVLALLATGVAMTLLLANIIAIQSCNTKKWDAKTDAKKDWKTTIPTSAMPGGTIYHTSDGKCVYFRKDEVQKIVAKMPAFDGDLGTFMGKTMAYPKDAIERNVQGRVMTKFVVTKDGDVVNAEIIKSPDSSLSAAALRVINTMPKWIAGETETGEKVPVEFILPIQFKL